MTFYQILVSPNLLKYSTHAFQWIHCVIIGCQMRQTEDGEGKGWNEFAE